MPRYELTEKQVQNLKALIMDANIKGAAAPAIVELLTSLDKPVVEDKENDLRCEHKDRQEHGTGGTQEDDH